MSTRNLDKIKGVDPEESMPLPQGYSLLFVFIFVIVVVVAKIVTV